MNIRIKNSKLRKQGQLSHNKLLIFRKVTYIKQLLAKNNGTTLQLTLFFFSQKVVKARIILAKELQKTNQLTKNITIKKENLTS